MKINQAIVPLSKIYNYQRYVDFDRGGIYENNCFHILPSSHNIFFINIILQNLYFMHNVLGIRMFNGDQTRVFFDGNRNIALKIVLRRHLSLLAKGDKIYVKIKIKNIGGRNG